MMQRLFRFYFWLLGFKFNGTERMPATGGFVVCANHRSNWDVLALACALERPIHFMAKEELFQKPILGSAFRFFGAFPIKRGVPDMKALKHGIELLKAGEIVGIFPEGTRVEEGQKQVPFAGMIFMMEKAGVPVLPVQISGTRQLWKRSAPKGLIVGTTLLVEELPEKTEVEENLRTWRARMVMQQIEALQTNS
jgi:1-acyl-sn-glycerol-3-phosphate acyltransferase